MKISSQKIAERARFSTIHMTSRAKAAHVGSSLSVIDILSVLFSEITSVSTAGETDEDLVFVSKGHAAAGTYSVLAHTGYFPVDWLDTYCENDSPLIGHVNKYGVPGVAHSTGSLGHALPFACGKALASIRQGSSRRYYVVLSDGECDEGSNWEAALVASHLSLTNLTVLIDRNRLQSLQGTEETIALEPLADKWKSFGWDVEVIDGHNHTEIHRSAFGKIENRSKPKVVICETIKGYGVSFMENSVLWHYKSPTGEFLTDALEELGRRE